MPMRSYGSQAGQGLLKMNIEQLVEYFNSKDDGYYSRNYSTRKMFEINVKIYNFNSDLPAILAKYSKKYHALIKENFKDDQLNELLQDYLMIEREYLMDIFKQKAQDQAMSAEDWQKYAGDYIDKREKTSYPVIDELKTIKEKRAKLAEFIARDKEMLDAFDIVSEYHFAGRMGGHFVFDVYGYGQYISDAEDAIWTLTESKEATKEEKQEAENILNNCRAELQAIADKVEYIKQYVRKQHKALDFQPYLSDKVDEFIAEVKEDETKSKDKTITNQTLGELLQNKNDIIRRNAMSILKQSQHKI